MRTKAYLCGVVSALVLALLLAGCKKRPTEADEGGGKNPISANPAGAGPQANAVLQGAQRQVNMNLMRGIGTYYNIFRSERGRPPKDVKEFKAYLADDPDARNVVKAMEGDWLVMVINPNSTSNIIAYEKDLFPGSERLVLLKDGAVPRMSEADFQAALKGQ